jgi:hypothetical protein
MKGVLMMIDLHGKPKVTMQSRNKALPHAAAHCHERPWIWQRGKGKSWQEAKKERKNS